MAQRVGGPWLSVGKLIELFVAMGCELGRVPGTLRGPDGEYEVRYLYSDVTDDFISLGDYADDELVPPSEVENWERRLGIVVPKGDHH